MKNKLFAGIQIPDHLHSQEYIRITNIDFGKDVEYLKKKIAEEIKFSDANNLEIIFEGRALANELKLENAIKPNGIIHIFRKTKQYEPYIPSPKCKDPKFIQRMQELFALIAHIQLNVTSRVTILQKILNEYPEFRRNMGAQAIIRDSVLFNTIHQNMEKIAENYPLICEAAPFIVDTIKKELTRSAPASLGHPAETANESPNSSEEENSLGASSSNESGTPSHAQNEESRIRAITRQQLQNALALVDTGNNSNSLSSIALRNAESNTSRSAPQLPTSASGERISAEMFRQEMARAFRLLGSMNSSQDSAQPTATTSSTTTSNASEVQPMDTSDTTPTDVYDSSLLESDTIPASYRNHEYAEQLRTMAAMGFLSHEENLQYLTVSNGNIANAINILMGSFYEE